MLPFAVQEGAGFFTTPVGLAVLIALAIVALVVIGVVMKYGLLYVQALLSGARVGLFDLVGMSLRRVPSLTIVNARIMGVKAGIPIETSRLEAHALARGNVINVVTALIA